MANSIASLPQMLKEVFVSDTVKLLEKNDFFFETMRTLVPKSVNGNDEAIIPYTVNKAFAQAIELSSKPNVSKFNVNKMSVKMVKLYSKIFLNDYDLQILKSNNRTITKNQIRDFIMQLLEAPKDEFLRLFFADQYGTFATVNGDQTATTAVKVDWYSGVPLLEVWRKIKIWTPAEIEAGTADLVEVIGIDEETVYIDTAIDVADWDIIVDEFAYEAGSGWKKFNSIEWITDDGTDFGDTFQNQDRTKNMYLQGNRLVWTTNVLTDLDNLLSKINIYSKTKKEIVVVAGIDKYNEIVSKLQANRQLSTNNMKDLVLTGGYTGIQYVYNGVRITLVPHWMAKKDRIYAFDKETLWKVIITDSAMMSEAGTTLVQEDLGYYSISRMYGNVVALRPRATGKIIY